MKATIVALGATLLATLALTPAHAQQPQCPITCSGTCSNNAAVTCSTNADCIGATVASACPCGGSMNPGGQVTPWKNHGQYQSCVVHERNTLRKEGCSTAGIASCSARSTCGKPAAVLCCKVASTGTCMMGTCSNSSSTSPVSCTTDADCTRLSGPHTRRDAASCTNAGGFVSGTGSVCSGCTPPVACCVSGTCEVVTAADCTSLGGSSTAGAAPTCTGVVCQ